MDASSLSQYNCLDGWIDKVPFVSRKRGSTGSWISFIPIVQLDGAPNGNLYKFLSGFRSHNKANFGDFIFFMYFFFYRKRLKNIQSFKTHVLSSLAIKSLVLPSRRRSGLETLSKPRRRQQRGRSKTKTIMSRTIAMECSVRETEAYGRERIMSVAVNHAVSSN